MKFSKNLRKSSKGFGNRKFLKINIRETGPNTHFNRPRVNQSEYRKLLLLLLSLLLLLLSLNNVGRPNRSRVLILTEYIRYTAKISYRFIGNWVWAFTWDVSRLRSWWSTWLDWWITGDLVWSSCRSRCQQAVVPFAIPTSNLFILKKMITLWRVEVDQLANSNHKLLNFECYLQN